MDENDAPRKARAYEVGMPLDTLSVNELEDHIELLEKEIVRLRDAIARKKDSRSAADAVFKL